MKDILLDEEENFSFSQVEYAGFWIRFGAYFIDGIILYIVQLILGFTIGMLMEDVISGMYIVNAVSFAVGWIYFAALESSENQGTIGKQAVGIKVVNEEGERISFVMATGRYFGKLLSILILFIGFIMAAFDSKKQALHDKIVSTYVIKK